MMRIFVRLAVVALAAAGLSAIFTCRNAAAAEFVMRPCEGPDQNVAWVRSGTSGFETTIACPTITATAGARLGNGLVTTIARWPSNIFRDSSLYIKRARVVFRGAGSLGLGAKNGVRFCTTETSCGPLLPREGAVDGAAQFEYQPGGSGDIPMTARYIEIVSSCELNVTCPAVDSFEVGDMELVFEDFVVPRLDWSEPSAFQSYLGSNKWIQAAAQIAFNASDSGSGVAHTRFEYSPSGHSETGPAPCSLLDAPFATRFCLVDSRGPEWTPDPRTRPDLLPEGRNTVRFWAADMAGRTSTVREISFNVDITPPKAPTSLRISGSPTGWTDQTSVDVEWDPVDDGAGEVKATFVRIGDSEAALAGSPGVLRGAAIAPNADTEIAVHAIDRAGNTGAISRIVVGHDDHVLAAPVLRTREFAGAADLEAPGVISWDPPSDAAAARSGVCGYSLAVDDDPEGEASTKANLDSGSLAAPAPGGQINGVHFIHLRAVTCAGRAGRTAHAAIEYDLTPPRADHDRPQSTWLTEGEPLRIHGIDAQSGMAAMRYSVDGADETRVAGESAEVVMPDGLHELRYRAEDRAGNLSEPRSVLLGVDGTPPLAWFETADPERPTLVKAFAADERAGIESAQFVYASAGEWVPFGDEHRPSPGVQGAVSLTARFPDASLPDGRYPLGIRVRDRVGREAIARQTLTGAEAALALPLRAAPSLRLAVSQHGRLRHSVFTRFGAASRVIGRLRDAAGEPIAGARIQLSERRAFDSRRHELQVTQTGRDGGFEAIVRPGVARRIYAAYGGNEVTRPAERDVLLHTRARVALRVSPGKVRAGGRLRFDMRVWYGSAPISNVGKVAFIQFLSPSGRWKNFISPRSFNLLRDPKRPGWARFVAFDEAPAFESARRLRFRLAVPLQELWPYAHSWSRPVDVLVVPRKGAPAAD